MPRKPLDLDLTELEKLAAMHCTQQEVAAFFNTTRKTISLKLRQEPYKSAWERGWGKGNISLRRKQFQAAEAGDRTMLVWLGKQWLGQTDKSQVDERSKVEVIVRRVAKHRPGAG